MKKIVLTAKILECVLFIPELKLIIDASKIELESAISNSRAASYVNNPNRFNNDIIKNNITSPCNLTSKIG
ncbi:MAG: hypothetical protein HRU38_02035 [Saccharospirillaceae bacterium]|nr:hypothetical protein [Pseudomonadales bacterium]NRB77439.1 hypothetical protein [Saccharospirillaceae bacterium]